MRDKACELVGLLLALGVALLHGARLAQAAFLQRVDQVVDLGLQRTPPGVELAQLGALALVMARVARDVIEDRDGHRYQPDFVVETTTEMLIVEPKSRAELNDETTRRKAEAAVLWCHIATEFHARKHGGKPWRYLLIPDDEIGPNSTLVGLIGAHLQAVDMELLERYSLSA